MIFNIEDKQTKEDPIVVYCGDPGCGDSEDLAYDLKNEGFQKLFVFKGWLECQQPIIQQIIIMNKDLKNI